MRVADYIAEFVHTQLGVRDVFMVTGGGAMYLNDGVACHAGLRARCNHHEQAAAMAAVGYAKTTGGYAVVMVTTGCGGTNTITGLLDAWQDNVPCVFVSGQAKRAETVRNCGLPLRQIGVQEADIIPVVSSLTKYAVMINDPAEAAYHLEKAAYLARNGRPGPVWIDVPLDVQAAPFDPRTARHFDPAELKPSFKSHAGADDIAVVDELLRRGRRPLILAGNGVRISGARDKLLEFVERHQIPVVTSFLGIDLLPSDHPLCVGRVGIKGDRAGNFALQNCDVLIALGTRLCVAMTGYEYKLFAREAKIVVVDIDPYEHQKKTIRIDHFVNSDVASFLDALPPPAGQGRDEWADRCRHWRDRWPVYQPEYAAGDAINMYHLVHTLSEVMSADSVVVSDAGSAFYVVAQALRIRGGQRHITSGGQAEMGFTLPAALGACFAREKREVIGITGDGSLQMNLQELQTIVHHQLPVKLFIMNNGGYLSIRTTQSKFFEGRFIGTDEASGISFPSIRKLSDAYGIQYVLAKDPQTLASRIREVLAFTGPVLCEVMCPKDQEVVPTVSSARLPDGRMVSRPLEDMYPFLSREDLRSEMIVKLVEE